MYFVYASIILYTLLYVLPAIYGVIMSFTDWNQIRDMSTIKFIGFENFKRVFSQEENYFKYIGNTFWFTMVTSAIKMVLALAAALFVNKGLKFRNFHRMAFFFPSIISVVVTGLVFRSILRPTSGLLNTLLIKLGLNGSTDWLNHVETAFASAMAVDIWRGFGYIMIIFLAGLQSISSSYYEAAEIDGAGYFSKLKYITLPLLKQTMLVNLMLSLVYGLRVFDMIYVLTRGGPGDASDVLYTIVFREFGRGNYAIGSALSTVMLIFLLFFGTLCIKFILKQEVEQ